MTSDKIRERRSARTAAQTLNQIPVHGPISERADDDLDREVYGILGVPIDAADLETVLRKVASAAANRGIYFISTVNLNYVATSLADEGFRDSLLLSDLCPVDGMRIVWIARLLGLPIKRRVAGSDLFDAMRASRDSAPLKIFLFGGQPNVASTACAKINAASGGLICVGSFEPGFGSVEDMSTNAVIDTINASGADFLMVALGAKKGQAWLSRNHKRLTVPVRAHLGATINFHAGTVKRAPRWMRTLGAEWFWRILVEPQLWRRYGADGMTLAWMVVFRIFPLAVLAKVQALSTVGQKSDLVIDRIEDSQNVHLYLRGTADCHHITVATSCFRRELCKKRPIVINLAHTRSIDSRFLGLLLMLDKRLKGQRFGLTFAAVPPRIRRIFRLSGFEFLLSGEERGGEGVV
jgi:N-acetylglucosaminyldiphosphoundecaprenol N-acetyl-beta-D-mannosaminyltransferase